jgi:hypothetical protein
MDLGSGLYGEDDPGSRTSVNPDQTRNSVESPDPSDHPQETHYPEGFPNSVKFGHELPQCSEILPEKRQVVPSFRKVVHRCPGKILL